MNRELLEQPFKPEQIKQRAGAFGQTLQYIEGHAVIQRMNEAFDGQWSFRIKSHDMLESEIIVLGELCAGTSTKTQFGSSTITKSKSTGEVLSLADDFKAAATDALKKCATMFGVGLHLYAGQSVESSPSIQSAHQGSMPPGYTNGGSDSSNNSSSDNGDYGNDTNGKGRLSSKQYNFILNLAVKRGLTQNAIDKKAVDEYGAVVAHLSKDSASTMIKQMLNH